MTDIITNNLTEFIATIKEQMESDDPIARKYADSFYTNLQKMPPDVKSAMSFHYLRNIWEHMVRPLLVDADRDGWTPVSVYKQPCSNTPDYVTEELECATDEESEFAIFYKGGQISMNEIVLRLNRLSYLEKQNDDISMLVLNWTEKTLDVRVDEIKDYDQGYQRGYHDGIDECRENMTEIWSEGWKL